MASASRAFSKYSYGAVSGPDTTPSGGSGGERVTRAGAMQYTWISPERALVFRITHIDNIRWIVQNGLHCRNGRRDRAFVTIGNPDIIARRDHRLVPVEPGGSLSDYIPFYFTPFSPMAFNIKTGHGVAAVPPRDIVILVASLRRLAGEPEVRFVYTDRPRCWQRPHSTNP